jgi:hypothetical protein
MALRKIDHTTPIEECPDIWAEWKTFHDDLQDQFPDDPAAVAINFEIAYRAAFDGIVLTERAAKRLLEEEAASRPKNPYKESSDVWLKWEELEFAKSIGHNASVMKLSRELARMQFHEQQTRHSTSTPAQHSPLGSRRAVRAGAADLVPGNATVAVAADPGVS